MTERRKKFFAKGHVLDPHRATPDGRWQGVSKLYVYPNECNDRAGEFLLDNFGHGSGRDSTLVRLVHGYYSPPDLSFATQHAWVDLGTGVVFDGVLQGFYDAAGYPKVYRTEVVAQYTVVEMVCLMNEHEHWGPWHPDGEMPSEGVGNSSRRAGKKSNPDRRRGTT